VRVQRGISHARLRPLHHGLLRRCTPRNDATAAAKLITMKAVYPGSFDPLTLGHLDIVKRAAKIFGSVELLISENPNKQGVLSIEERVKLVEAVLKAEGLNNISIKSYSGLTVDYAKQRGFTVLLRGMRAASDFEAELEMSQVNNFLSELETVFLMTSPEYSFIRASRVWELLRLGADISNLVPKQVANYLKEHISGYLQQN